uniref:Uncharacterized protein n=1 Tax=Aegilops tauschii subsp. strangulata TaxID=200361 RepID=A0A453KS13_AEGTS
PSLALKSQPPAKTPNSSTQGRQVNPAACELKHQRLAEEGRPSPSRCSSSSTDPPLCRWTPRRRAGRRCPTTT